MVSLMEDETPTKISRNMVNSTRACPMNTDCPALQPFLRDMPIVANIIGPGMRAADIATVIPRKKALISSMMDITLQKVIIVMSKTII